MLCLILLDSFVDVGLERKGALLCMRLRLILTEGRSRHRVARLVHERSEYANRQYIHERLFKVELKIQKALS